MENKRILKTGFTTGTASAAAANSALSHILKGFSQDKVLIKLLTGDYIEIPVCFSLIESYNKAKCIVIKDAGDDPDITHKAEIGANVIFSYSKENKIEITGGIGVGIVTKPGLELAPGSFAINPGPVKMIKQAVCDVLEEKKISGIVKVEIFVPKGIELAKKTLNKRLGILGGISILGTTGIVKPLSHEAYIATIKALLSVAFALNIDTVVFTTGRRSEKCAQNLFQNFTESSFIQIGDFFKTSLDIAVNIGISNIYLAVFFGKAVKMARGDAHTHADKAHLTMKELAEWSFNITKDSDFANNIMSANTARHAFDLIKNKYPEIIIEIGNKMVNSARIFVNNTANIRGIIFDYDFKVIFDSGCMI